MAKHETKAEEMREEEHKKEKMHHRKRGGAVHGKMPKHRPDKRARGGGTADEHPMTSAEHMSAPSYEGGRVGQHNEGGRGPDRE